MESSKLHIIQNSPPSQQFDLINAQLFKSNNISSAPRKKLTSFLSNLMHEKGYLELIDAVITLNYSYKLDCTFKLHLRIFSSKFSLPRFSNHLINLHGIHRCKHTNQSKLTYKMSTQWVLFDFMVISIAMKSLNFCHRQISIAPTYYVNEGLPISAIEAMAHGLPIIGTPWRWLILLMKISMVFVEPHNPFRLFINY